MNILLEHIVNGRMSVTNNLASLRDIYTGPQRQLLILSTESNIQETN